MDMRKAGQKLMELRGDKKREIVAAETGVSLSSLASYELGLRTPRDGVKERLANYYGVPVSEIFF